MKYHKILTLALGISLINVVASASLTMNWGYLGTLATPVPSVQSGWVVQLYQDVGVNTLLSSITSFNASDLPVGGNSSDDQILGSFQTTVSSAKGQFGFLVNGLSADTIAGLTVYTVLFNNSVRTSATQAWIIDTTPRTLLSSGIDSYTANATPSTVGYGPLAVAAVPEPSSVALIGVGLAAIALRRRFAK